MRIQKIENIFIHCSATSWGNVLVFDKWHRENRGWKGVGYHYVILNGRPDPDTEYWRFLDGMIQPGRRLDDDPIFEKDEVGAHVAGRNLSSIGICLVGKIDFTIRQLLMSKILIKRLLRHFDLEIDNVLGHYEDRFTWKTCPNIVMPAFRDFLRGEINVKLLKDCIAEEARLNFYHLKLKKVESWYQEWKKKRNS
jgi:hypothetical protein